MKEKYPVKVIVVGPLSTDTCHVIEEQRRRAAITGDTDVIRVYIDELDDNDEPVSYPPGIPRPVHIDPVPVILN